jgi:hypothetical protein
MDFTKEELAELGLDEYGPSAKFYVTEFVFNDSPLQDEDKEYYDSAVSADING